MLLKGWRIAVIEDEFLIAKDICEIVKSFGAEIVGPFSTVVRALAGLQQGKVDAALLDLNLIGQNSLPVAKRLKELQIPFIVMTGYGSNMIEDDLMRSAPMVPKPFDEAVLLTQLASILGVSA